MRDGLERAAFLTFLVLIAFLPFGIAGQQLAFAATLLLVVASGTMRGRLRTRWETSARFRGIVIGIAVWGVALLVALAAGETGAGFRELRKFPLMLLVILPVAIIRTSRLELHALRVLSAAFLLAAVAGLYEQARGLGDHPTRLDGPIGFYMTSTGVFLQASLLFLVLALRSPVDRALRVTTLFATTAALVLTYTRGAWFAWLAATACLLVVTRSRAGIAALAGFAIVLIAYTPVRERLVTSWDTGYAMNVERTYLWQAGVELVRKKPVFGWGLQSLEPVIESHRPPEASERLTHLHSNWLQTAAAMGLVGLAALLHWIARLYGGLGLTGVLRRRGTGSSGGTLPLAALTALTGFLLHGTLEWNLGDSEVITTLYTILGLGLAHALRDGPSA